VAKPDASLTFDEMVAYLKDAKLSVHKIPEQLEFVDSLPRNPSGKVLKKDLRATYGKTS
jgi:fatty-acyl-CoA synthase